MHINVSALYTAKVKEPKLLLPWINHQDSLTDKLKLINRDIELKLLVQHWINPTWWDKYILNQDEPVFQREIIMKSRGVACWYARTVIPQKCHALEPQFFNRLQQESIRNLIFDNSDVHRVNMTCYPVNQQCIEFYWVKKYLPAVHGVLWVRCAEFSFKNQESFYLIDLLLPELEGIN
ncbi:MAG: chorismate--pyruvate lyase family protein [Gammaproteobacteria bacterium]